MRRLACILLGAIVPLAVDQQLSTDGAIVRGPADRRVIALVFTGHEFAEGGDAILAALGARRTRASFFLTGDFLRRAEFEPLVRRIVGAGHYLGPHSDKHLLYCDWTAKKTLVTRDAFRADLEGNLREIERFGRRRAEARYFLPAYEWCNTEIVGWAREMNLTTVNLTPGTRSNADYTEDTDPAFVGSEQIAASILAAAAAEPNGLNGFLLLMHIGAGPRRTDKLHDRLPGLLEALAARGYQFARVDEMLAGTGRR